MFKRRVAPSPPPSRRISPSPPPYSRRIAPSPPSPFSDYQSSSVRLKATSSGEWSPPPVKRRIAPPPPESFINTERSAGYSSTDNSRHSYSPSELGRYDSERHIVGPSDRPYYDGPGGMEKRPRKEYNQKWYPSYTHDTNGSYSNKYPPNEIQSGNDNYSYRVDDENFKHYPDPGNGHYKPNYKEEYREPKIRKPPPAPHIPASSKRTESQKPIADAPNISTTSSNQVASSQAQDEEGEWISDAENDDDGEEGEWISNNDRIHDRHINQRQNQTKTDYKSFDPNSFASLDEQEQQVGNSIIVRKDATRSSYSKEKDETGPKKPPLPLHIQKSPLKGSFISSSILTRDENNMYTEVKKVGLGATDDSTNSSTIDDIENDNDIENVSGDNTDEENEIELEEGEETPKTMEKDSLTVDYIKQSPHLMLDSKFLAHLAEMHPVSALNELSHKPLYKRVFQNFFR